RFALVAVVEDGLEVAGQARRWGDEREASTHESCIVAQWHLGRGQRGETGVVAWLFSSMGGRRHLSVEYEHMFAFGQQKGTAPRSRELPIGLADRVRPSTPVAGRLLPVPPPLAPLFPDRA